jgi:multiple sugar transport system permease protein
MTTLTIPRTSAPNKHKRNPWVRRIMRIFTIYIPVIVVLFVMLLPFYWMLSTSLKPNPEMFNRNISPFYPQEPTTDHWAHLFNNTAFPEWFVNTTYIAVSSTAIAVVLSVLAAYSLSRLRYKGRSTLSALIFISYLIPTTLLFIPMAEVVKQLQLLNAREALILVYPTFQIPFCTWLLMGYFRTIPIELEESAMIDGATRWQSLTLIAIPLAVPGIVTAVIFAFTLAWNEYIYALILITTESLRTIPVGVLTRLVNGDMYFWGPLMAAAFVGSVPVVILYAFFVENYVGGLTAGSVKG